MPNDFRIKRREFMLLLASLPLARVTPLAAAPQISYSEEPLQTLDVVFEHMFPAQSAIAGARDLGVMPFIQTSFAAPDSEPDEIEFIKNGVGWLNGVANNEYKKSFIELNETEREITLRKIESSETGNRWLSKLLSYLIEALLSDPIYGSNKHGAVWSWLQHPPGYPVPPADKTFFKLGYQTRRKLKA
jgi:gluconate 2-dehydrogenase gamma chain